MSECWSHWQRNTCGKRGKGKKRRLTELDTATSTVYYQATLGQVIPAQQTDQRSTTPSSSTASTTVSFGTALDLLPKSTNENHGENLRNRVTARRGVPLHDFKSSKDTVTKTESTNNSDPIRDIIRKNPGLSEAHIQQIMSSRLLSEDVNIHENHIAGLAHVKHLIRTRIIHPIQRPELHRGLYKPCNGILLFGPPGTGKTTLAKWVATECQANFFNIMPSTLISMFHGETENLVRTLYAIAHQLAPSIIFFDEIDSLLSRRNEKEEEATTRMKNQLLQVMDGIEGDKENSVITIGATNRPEALDEAALRRLSKRIFIPLPDRDSVKCQILNSLKIHSEEMGVPYDPFNDTWIYSIVDKLANFNGSDIQCLCVKAAELVYDRILDRQNGDLSRVSTSDFYVPGELEFLEAVKYINPSGARSCAEVTKWVEAEKRFSSF